MLLFINTSEFDIAELALVSDKVIWHKFGAENLSEQLLPEIKKFCSKQKVALIDLKKIAVVTGPGSFSRIRTGIATANALAYSLKIAIVGLEKNQIPQNLVNLKTFKTKKMAVPAYGKEPNITISKKN